MGVDLILTECVTLNKHFTSKGVRKFTIVGKEKDSGEMMIIHNVEGDLKVEGYYPSVYVEGIKKRYGKTIGRRAYVS